MPPLAGLVALCREAAGAAREIGMAAIGKWRGSGGPGPAVARARERGAGRRVRDAAGRRRLRRVIRVLDVLAPGGGCYRRALVEMALDGGAAREALHLGLRAGGGPGSGHAWLASHAARASDYDAVVAL